MPFYTGTVINVLGVMLAYQWGRLVAVINNEGKIVWRENNVPVFFVEYLLMPAQPGQDNYKLN